MGENEEKCHEDTWRTTIRHRCPIKYRKEGSGQCKVLWRPLVASLRKTLAHSSSKVRGSAKAGVVPEMFTSHLFEVQDESQVLELESKSSLKSLRGSSNQVSSLLPQV